MVDNQHQKITGYPDLSQDEIDLINRVKEQGEQLGELVMDLQGMGTQIDQRWVDEGHIGLQKGIMCLVRSIAQPTSF